MCARAKETLVEFDGVLFEKTISCWAEQWCVCMCACARALLMVALRQEKDATLCACDFD